MLSTLRRLAVSESAEVIRAEIFTAEQLEQHVGGQHGSGGECYRRGCFDDGTLLGSRLRCSAMTTRRPRSSRSSTPSTTR
jgi:hypothetical protein